MLPTIALHCCVMPLFKSERSQLSSLHSSTAQWRSEWEERVEGRTAPGGTQEGRQNWGCDQKSGGNSGKNKGDNVITAKMGHQASQDFWWRQNWSPPRAPITHATPLIPLLAASAAAINDNSHQWQSYAAWSSIALSVGDCRAACSRPELSSCILNAMSRFGYWDRPWDDLQLIRVRALIVAVLCTRMNNSWTLRYPADYLYGNVQSVSGTPARQSVAETRRGDRISSRFIVHWQRTSPTRADYADAKCQLRSYDCAPCVEICDSALLWRFCS